MTYSLPKKTIRKITWTLGTFLISTNTYISDIRIWSRDLDLDFAVVIFFVDLKI